MSAGSEQPDIMAEAHDLIIGLIEDCLDPAQMDRLETLALQNADVCRLYVTYMHQRCLMTAMAQPTTQTAPSTDSMHDTMVLEAISREAAEAEKNQPRPIARPLLIPVKPANNATPVVRRSGWAAAAAAFIALAGLLFFLSRPRPTAIVRTLPAPAGPVVAPPLATVTRVIGATWANATPAQGNSFDAPTHLSLTTGYAEIAFASGADMVVQAPAEFVIQSNNSVSLQSGKIAARVPPPAIGFSVSAGRSTIIDLGTEFGVSENLSGTEVDVFKGKVTAGLPSTRPTLLTANDSATIDKVGKINLARGGAEPQRFVRHLETNATFLDAVDLAAGGDGTTARRGPVIDANTGNYGQLPPMGTVLSVPGYHKVGLAVIDGSFIPNKGNTQIDSAGHQFVFNGATGVTFSYISTGTKNDWPASYAKLDLSSLGGVDYSVAPHGYLLQHASSGLTFDLAAIAALHPDCRLTGFRCILGNPVPIKRGGNPATMVTSAFVIVDGEARYQRLNFTNKDEPAEVTVPIGPTDRFLTLATSHEGWSVQLAWVLFADPKFSLSK